jgi:hypothetical protein
MNRVRNPFQKEKGDIPVFLLAARHLVTQAKNGK